MHLMYQFQNVAKISSRMNTYEIKIERDIFLTILPRSKDSSYLSKLHSYLSDL